MPFNLFPCQRLSFFLCTYLLKMGLKHTCGMWNVLTPQKKQFFLIEQVPSSNESNIPRRLEGIIPRPTFFSTQHAHNSLVSGMKLSFRVDEVSSLSISITFFKSDRFMTSPLNLLCYFPFFPSISISNFTGASFDIKGEKRQ